jgi:formylglycine-generating enzyme required for sulfatase activity
MVKISGGTYLIGEQHPAQPWHEPAKSVDLDDFFIDIYEYPGKEGEMPRGDVNWDDAKALCSEAGKRLCTSYEWERACRGLERNRYSYGSERDATACNTPVEGSGPGQSPAPIAPSGSYERCKTAEGVFDLNGSLSEWVIDPWNGQPEPFNAEESVDPKSWRMLRGGTMWDKTFYGQDCTSRHGHKIAFKNMDDGFRCCRD